MQSIISVNLGSLRWKMLKVMMCILGGVGSLLVIQYLGTGIHQKKHGKPKQVINDELIELLKE